MSVRYGKMYSLRNKPIFNLDALKRTSSCDESNGHIVKSKRLSDLLQDIIVLGLPYTTTAHEVEKYFTDLCGELAFHEVRCDEYYRTLLTFFYYADVFF